jgi:hypothetical protein
MDTPKKGSKKRPGQRFILPTNENNAKAIMTWSGRSNFPVRDGNGMYPSALEGTGFFKFRRARIQAISRKDFSTTLQTV